jgi:hypothetical protein
MQLPGGSAIRRPIAQHWRSEIADRKTRMSALPSKADMCGTTRDVRFGPKADIALERSSSRRLRASRGYKASHTKAIHCGPTTTSGNFNAEEYHLHNGRERVEREAHACFGDASRTIACSVRFPLIT